MHVLIVNWSLEILVVLRRTLNVNTELFQFLKHPKMSRYPRKWSRLRKMMLYWTNNMLSTTDIEFFIHRFGTTKTKKHRRQICPAKFKAEVIQGRENGLKPNELVQKYSNFRLDEPKISRWMKEKHAILTAAAGKHKSLLKIRPSIKHNELFDKPRPLFNEARSKGQFVDFNWLWSKARKIYKGQGKEKS